MSLASQMKDSIESYANDLKRTSPLSPIIANRAFTPRAMAVYLDSLRYLFAHTEQHLRIAAMVSESQGRLDLALYFRQKCNEEQSHDQWAIDDLKKLPAAVQAGVQPAKAIVDLVDLQARFIEEDPLLFAAYAQWTEYFSVYLGEEWLSALSDNGYQRENVTAIGNHLDVDQDHAATGFRELDGLARGFISDAAMLEAIDESGRVFALLCRELAEISMSP